jgi:hypothetical protein
MSRFIFFCIAELTGWLRLLPNMKCLFVSISELTYWITNGGDNLYLDVFFQRLNQIFIECSFIINKNLNEEMMVLLLTFIINKRRFPRLECLSFIQCEHISSSWCNINKCINFIFTHLNEHQLKHLRFSFIGKEQEITDMQTGDEIITITEPSCVADIHRFVSENRISFWIQRIYKSIQ